MAPQLASAGWPSASRPPVASPISASVDVAATASASAAAKAYVNSVVPISNQVPVLYAIVVFVVVIFAFWNIPGARSLINPLKMFTIGWHELCHILMAIMTGGTVRKVTIDPNTGGCTLVEGGHPPTILASGYIGSVIFGGLLVMAGFDTLVAKIMSFVIALGLLCPLVLVRDKLTLALTAVYESLLIGFWFIDHADALRWYCLFIGIMNIFYVVWDICDDKFFRKANDSDCTQFQIMYPRITAHVWAILWILFAVGALIGFIFLGISQFKVDANDMRIEADRFLPT